MATHARGLICLCLTPERCDELGLRQMTDQNEAQFGTAFTVTIEARDGVSTGISAADRAHTIQVAIDPTSTPHDLVHPGHVFPLRAREGGVLKRSGQTEAAVDLARLAGLQPAGVVCEIMKDDGTMARVPDLVPFCERHGLKLVTVADLIEYRKRTEKLVERVVSVRLPTEYGEFEAVAYRETLTGKQHVALVKGDVAGARGRARPGALGVPHGRRLPLPPLRLRRAARAGARADRGRRARRPALSGAGRARDRAPQQAARLRAPGAGPRHRGGEPRARLQGRPPRVRHRLADPRRPRADDDPGADQQPTQDLGHQRLRAHRRLPGADRGGAERREPRIPRDEAGQAGPHDRSGCTTRASGTVPTISRKVGG